MVSDPLPNFTLLAAAWVSLWYFPHCLIHFTVGRLLGIRFTHYVIGKTALVKLGLPYVTGLLGYLPVLGLRVERRSLQEASSSARRLMFVSGAYGSMLLPIISVVYSLIHSSTATVVLLMVMTVANVAITLYYSPRAGDIWRSTLPYR